MLQLFLPAVDGENINDAHEVALTWPVDHMDGVFAVWQQPAMMVPEVLKLCVTAVLWHRAVQLLEGDLLSR